MTTWLNQVLIQDLSNIVHDFILLPKDRDKLNEIIKYDARLFYNPKQLSQANTTTLVLGIEYGWFDIVELIHNKDTCSFEAQQLATRNSYLSDWFAEHCECSRIIIGPRRTGKTVLIASLLRNRH
jgi:hypothetical protein